MSEAIKFSGNECKNFSVSIGSSSFIPRQIKVLPVSDRTLTISASENFTSTTLATGVGGELQVA